MPTTKDEMLDRLAEFLVDIAEESEEVSRLRQRVTVLESRLAEQMKLFERMQSNLHLMSDKLLQLWGISPRGEVLAERSGLPPGSEGPDR